MENMKQHTSKFQKLCKYVLLLAFLFISSESIIAQRISLNNLGKKVLRIAQSGTPEKVLDLVNVGNDVENKASILESFLTIKTTMSNIGDIKSFKHFNTIIEKENLIYFIMKSNNKFYVVSSMINAKNEIVGDFKLIKSAVIGKIQAGEKVYKSRCYSCHGINGKGGVGPNLTDEYCKFIHSDKDLIDIISNGKKGTMMMAYKNYLSPQEIQTVAIYIKSIRGIEVKNGKNKEGDINYPNLVIFNN